MGSQSSRKINQLLQQWPKGTVATKAQLDKQGIYRQLATKYVYYRWIERMGSVCTVRRHC